MEVLSYKMTPQILAFTARMLKNSVRRRLFGTPIIKGDSPEEIAEKVILQNTADIIYAGNNNYRYNWVVDTGKAFKGLMKVLPRGYLASYLDRVIDESYRKGHVPTCFSRNSSFDMPWERADCLPWLVYMVDSLDHPITKTQEGKLERLYENYMHKYFDYDKKMIKSGVCGDWADTLLRPSSTYNNLCLLKMLEILEKRNGFETPANELEESLLERRLNGSYFLDYEGSGDWVVADANAIALYLELFDVDLRRGIADTLKESGLMGPVPMRMRHDTYNWRVYAPLTWLAKSYHSISWLHLGIMALNGFKAIGYDHSEHLKIVEEVVMKHGNFIETFDKKGNPFRSPFFVAEDGLTMAAGQFLELVR